VDGGDCRSHLLAEALGEKRAQLIVDALAARVFNGLNDRLGVEPAAELRGCCGYEDG
jgi:hypothetical protein